MPARTVLLLSLGALLTMPSAAQSPTSFSSLSDVWGAGSFVVAVGQQRNGDSVHPHILHSRDAGVTWQGGRLTNSPARTNAVWHEDGTVVAVGYLVLRSNWSDTYSLIQHGEGGQPLTDLYDIWGEGSTVVAVGRSGMVIRSVDAGRTWTGIRGVPSETFTAVWGDGQLVVIAGQSGTLLRSEDAGVSWHRVESGTTGNLYGVWGNGNTLIAVGAAGRIFRSLDRGNTWIAVATPVRERLVSVWGSSETVIALVADGSVIRSTDFGLTWNQVFTTSGHLRSIWGEDSTFIVVGSERDGPGDLILRSVDSGVSWTEIER